MLLLLLNDNEIFDGVKQLTYNRSVQYSTVQHSTAQHSTSGRHPPIFTCPKRSGTPWERFFGIYNNQSINRNEEKDDTR